MKILTGDETGLVKLVDVEENKVQATMGEQQKDCAAQHVLKLRDDYVVGGFQNGIIKLFSSIDGSVVFETALGEKLDIVGMDFCGPKNDIVAVQADGNVSLVEVGWTEDTPYLDDPIVLAEKVSKNAVSASINTYNSNRLMVLSKDVNPIVFDINSKKSIWKAKNMPNDYLDLQIPIYDLDCTFQSENAVYISTAYQKVRLYDLRKPNSRPTVDYHMKEEKSPLNNIEISSCGYYLYVTSSAGGVYVLDHRKDMQLVGKMKGSTGSVRDIAVSKQAPFAATVSLDRFMRVYNTNTYSLVRKIFMGQKLCSVGFFEDMLDDERLEETQKEQTDKKTQNDVHKAAKQTRSQLKKNKMKLTFQRKSDEAEDL